MTAANLADALAASGITVKRKGAGGHRCICPSCGRGAKDKQACSVKIDQDGGFVAHCFRCDWVTSWRPRQTMPQAAVSRRRDNNPPARDDKRPWDLYCDAILNASEPLKGTLGQVYLERRGCFVPDCRDVRFHRNQRGFPALVSRVTDPMTNKPMTLHLTLLKPDGSGKADTELPKLFLYGYPKKGGVIRLVDDADVEQGLGIAEGIETALSVMAAGWSPVWATGDASNLAVFPVLNGVESLTAFADRDKSGTGQRAADQVVQRWRTAGRDARIVLPPVEGKDWNDMIASAA